MQPGFGRTGTHIVGLSAITASCPIIVTLGKPMANGHPVSGVVARAELATEFAAKVMYFNTFGGNPVSCAAANAVLDVLERERLRENARVVGDVRARRTPERRCRGTTSSATCADAGLFFGAELVKDRRSKAPATAETRRIVNAMRDRGVLMSRIGVHDNVLKIRPPMPFSKRERGPAARDARRRPAGALSRDGRCSTS